MGVKYKGSGMSFLMTGEKGLIKGQTRTGIEHLYENRGLIKAHSDGLFPAVFTNN